MIFRKRKEPSEPSVSQEQFNFKIITLEEKFDKLLSAMEEMTKRQKMLVEKVSGMEDDITDVGNDITEFLDGAEYKPPPETKDKLNYFG